MNTCPYSTDCSGCVTYGERLLSVEHVNLSFGEKIVLRDVNAEIHKVQRRCHIQGCVIGFLGRSGSGKTQLARIISGLQQPTSGGVFINAEHDPVKAGSVGMVFQEYPLYEHRRVIGNLMIAAERKYKDYPEAVNQAQTILNRFGLTDKIKAYPAELSGGQRQRISIAQQLLSSDHFIILDEPSSGLDPIAKEELAKLIVDISCLDELNVVLVISHDIRFISAISDHMWVLGREEGLPGSRLVQFYDLVEMGLCWQQGITTRPDFVDFVREVEERFRTL
jgi:ABC-type polar amino acid transport system ATPase subunit